jgi:hypothetical protein
MVVLAHLYCTKRRVGEDRAGLPATVVCPLLLPTSLVEEQTCPCQGPGARMRPTRTGLLTLALDRVQYILRITRASLPLSRSTV